MEVFISEDLFSSCLISNIKKDDYKIENDLEKRCQEIGLLD